MKAITVEFSNDQSEFLDQISRMCNKDTPDFIREALICLLPLNEYIQAKNNLIELKSKKGADEREEAIKELFKDINISANNRLKRIGII